MLLTARILGITRSGRQAKTSAQWWDRLTVAQKVFFVIIALIFWMGTCVIFSRANPKVAPALKVLVFFLLIFVYDIYLLWFCLRMVIAQVQKQRVYVSLPNPSPIFGGSRK